MRHPLTIEKCCYRFDLDTGFFPLNHPKSLVMPVLAFKSRPPDSNWIS
jgi:hypothetical protein